MLQYSVQNTVDTNFKVCTYMQRYAIMCVYGVVYDVLLILQCYTMQFRMRYDAMN